MSVSLDFNHARTADRAVRDVFSTNFNRRIDSVIDQAARLAAINDALADIAAHPPIDDERPGRSVSASLVGDDCMRRIQLTIWESFHPGSGVTPEPHDDKTLAIFERGHRVEDLMGVWMQRAGFALALKNSDGEQFGFATANKQIKGFADGVLSEDGKKGLWEHKTVNARSWNAFVRHGVLKQSPKYDSQVQLMMAYMDAEHTMMTIINADTGELYAEHVPFDQDRAQAVSDRAVHILKATRAGDLFPRCASSGDKYPCKQCNRFNKTCWE